MHDYLYHPDFLRVLYLSFSTPENVILSRYTDPDFAIHACKRQTLPGWVYKKGYHILAICSIYDILLTIFYAN